MSGSTHAEDFLASLERCLLDDDFIPGFYRVFLDSSMEVRARFAKTDFERQHDLITKSLRMIAGVVVGDLVALKHLNERAESHCRGRMDIRPELYEPWRDALLLSAESKDPKWSDEIEEAWFVVLNQAIHHMVARYD